MPTKMPRKKAQAKHVPTAEDGAKVDAIIGGGQKDAQSIENELAATFGTLEKPALWALEEDVEGIRAFQEDRRKEIASMGGSAYLDALLERRKQPYFQELLRTNEQFCIDYAERVAAAIKRLYLNPEAHRPITKDARDAEFVEMRRKGMTYGAIAKKVNLSSKEKLSANAICAACTREYKRIVEAYIKMNRPDLDTEQHELSDLCKRHGPSNDPRWH